jgi:S1-C subfamily serine protease
MSAFDLVLAAVAAVAVIGGYRLGFVTRVASWIGLAVGLVLAVRLAPPFLERLDPSRPVLVITLAVGLLLVGASLGQALGFLVGSRLRPHRSGGVGGRVDGAAGALAGLVGVVVVVWLLLPVLASGPPWLSREVITSRAAQAIDDLLPRPPDTMEALRTLVGDANFPLVFEGLRPTPDLGPPPLASGLDEATSDAVARSILMVEGVACRQVQDGTGWVVAEGLVVTNAHVVAGQRDTVVIRDDGRRLDATVVAFDEDRDLAVLSVAGLDRPALPVAGAGEPGTVGGVFGHPGGEALRIAPFEVARAIDATGRDIYGDGTTLRRVLELSASLRPGDSGSPLVDPTGQVVGVAFAIARDRPEVAYALAPSELAPVLASAAARTEVSAGECITG